jgi:hypothetical protein
MLSSHHPFLFFTQVRVVPGTKRLSENFGIVLSPWRSLRRALSNLPM